MALVVGMLLSFIFFNHYFDWVMMDLEMEDRREDVLGVVTNVEGNSLSFIPLDMSEHPYKNLSLEKVLRELRLLTPEQRFMIQEIMKDKTKPEMTVEIPQEKKIYKRFYIERDWGRAVPISSVEINSLVIIWWEDPSRETLEVQHIMILPPEMFPLTNEQLDHIYKNSRES